MAKSNEQIKNYCNDCHQKTWHNILFIKSVRNSTEDFSWSIDYSVLQCAGCDRICYRTESSDSESYDIDEYGNFIPCIAIESYPPSNEGLGFVENIYELPREIKNIYDETIKSITYGCYTLAGIGLRAIIEAICLHENIPGRHLNTKVDRLVTNGFISKDDASKLHAIRFLGNDAAHEIKTPLKNQVLTALKIIEHLISSKYAMQDEIDKYLELPISSYEEFKNMLKKKIRQNHENKTFTLLKLIGKDKRRFEESDLNNFIRQYESEIANGKITIIEDVTNQLQLLQKENNIGNQKIYRKRKARDED